MTYSTQWADDIAEAARKVGWKVTGIDTIPRPDVTVSIAHALRGGIATAFRGEAPTFDAAVRACIEDIERRGR